MKRLLVFLFLFPLLAEAQSDKLMLKKGVDVNKSAPLGLKIGDKAPEINTKSITGEYIDSQKLLENNELVVIFYRGNWCPYCNRHLSNFNDSLEYIEAAGGKVIVIGPETFESAEKTADKAKASFTLIPDISLRLMQEFDVLFNVTKKYQRKIKTLLFTDIAKNNGRDDAQLPVPATYIIDKNGLIKWRHFDFDYTKRASSKSIIEQLNK